MSNNPLLAALNELRDDLEITGKDGVCPVFVEDFGSPVVVITGENAGGKSFLGSLLGQFARLEDDDLEVIDVTMRRRSNGYGLAKAMMFGNEDWETTGQISLKAMFGALRTCIARERQHLLILDEPDIGLSEGYQKAMGEKLAGFAAALPEHTQGFVLITHSRAIVQEMLKVSPTLVRVGDDLRPTREWLEHGALERNIEDLESLLETAHKRFRAITELIKNRKDSAASPTL